MFPVLSPGTGIAHSQWEQKRKAHCSAPGTRLALALWKQTPAVETAQQHRQGDTLAIHVWKSTALPRSSHSSLGTRVAKQPGIPGEFPSVDFLDRHSSFADGISCFTLSSRYSFMYGSACSGYRTRAYGATNSRVTGHCLTQLLLQSVQEMIQLLAEFPAWIQAENFAKCKEYNPKIINVKTFHFHTF